ncbi:DprA-like winged helix domain-containing protein [Microterricola viridarii]|uniref:DprA-like winged helix domain-containing protein n=1 Tax=Microterricola viridarii TaxID=412690 RepID=UPI0009F57B14|nr:hypothetical protein [Microterricola viridarii]
MTSPASAGCHRLLRDYDARCVTNAAEMAELLEPDAASPETSSAPGPAAAGRSRVQAAPDQLRVLDALSTRSARGVSDIAVRSGMAPNAVIATLGVLELEGRAREDERGWLRRQPG